MKKQIYFTFIFLMCSVGVTMAQDKKKTTQKIEEVTVFLKQAQIKSTVTTNIAEGVSEIIVEKLPQKLITSSLQVSGKGNFTIMSVKHMLDYLNPAEKNILVKRIEDSIARFSFLYDSAVSVREILQKEEELIIANQTLRGGQGMLNGDALDAYSTALEELADFFRDRTLQIKVAKMKNERFIKKIQEKLNALNNQLYSGGRLGNTAGSTVIITVSAKAATNATLTLSYTVPDAGWKALYDIRVKDTKSTAQIIYKAHIQQQSGIDWVNVKLKLSTQNPSADGTKPTLNPMYLNIYSTYYGYKKSKGVYKAEVERAMESEDALYNSEVGDSVAQTSAQFTNVAETSLAVEFDIKPFYTIHSNAQGQTVEIQVSEIQPMYRYSVVPKLDKDAFLMAHITGWESLNLLSGEASIYFEGTYVGTSTLNLNNTTDTLTISLGRDKKVVVERKTVKEFTSKKIIGTNRKDEFAYEITVRNTKKEPIDIEIEDQYPVSQNNSIQVELIESSGAQKEQTTGTLKWKLKIEPAETKQVSFRYSVKYPKDKIVEGLY
ncbi:MAG: DUF4139 domain-containing protein [Cytophagaceae bacterium]|nr:DUF4139 domain-containing protein [Cytophagaceae bacterium]MDW8456044.1 DUF4139 domain-containing protein [Cytophagaceae bacterium]